MIFLGRRLAVSSARRREWQAVHRLPITLVDMLEIQDVRFKHGRGLQNGGVKNAATSQHRRHWSEAGRG